LLTFLQNNSRNNICQENFDKIGKFLPIAGKSSKKLIDNEQIITYYGYLPLGYQGV
jgi:hypothetical protein